MARLGSQWDVVPPQSDDCHRPCQRDNGQAGTWSRGSVLASMPQDLPGEGPPGSGLCPLAPRAPAAASRQSHCKAAPGSLGCHHQWGVSPVATARSGAGAWGGVTHLLSGGHGCGAPQSAAHTEPRGFWGRAARQVTDPSEHPSQDTSPPLELGEHSDPPGMLSAAPQGHQEGGQPAAVCPRGVPLLGEWSRGDTHDTETLQPPRAASPNP